MKKNEMNLWVSVAVSPFLLSYIGIRSLSQWMIEVGKTSEEVFRGDRLPILRIPETGNENDAQSDK